MVHLSGIGTIHEYVSVLISTDKVCGQLGPIAV